jgi:predicted metalloprotease
MEPGDLEEGLVTAKAIGDDALQRRSGGRVVPERFTHGSSAERMAWLERGYRSQDPAQCDTFNQRD